MQAATPPALYYLTNFLAALSWISERSDDLLCSAERDFITHYQQLPVPSQALLARLILRKGAHFRLSALTYPEIGDISAAAEPLLALGWLDNAQPLDVATLHRLLRRAELIAVFDDDQALRQCTKAAMLEHLLVRFPQSRTFVEWCPTLGDTLLSVTIGELCDHLRLIYFGNLRQDWSEFVLADLGIFRYETVGLDLASRGFTCRQDVELHMRLHRAREAFEAGSSVPEVLAMIEGLDAQSSLLRTRLARFRFKLARELERQGEYDAALGLYAQSQYPEARQRQVRVLEIQGRHAEALQQAETALAAPYSDTEQQLLQRVVRRLRPRLGLPSARPARTAEQRLELSLPRGAHGVEWAVREHLHADHCPVHYVENALINSLFGLLCWEVIFAPLPGAFFHPFHSAPADLHDPDFHARRREGFATCLGQLETGAWRDSIRRTWQAKQGIQSPFVFWHTLDETLLEQALTCLPAVHLRIWFERLLLDIRANRCGMPDLIQFWPDEQRYRMIEVKGPGDRLQDNQRRWLELCAQHRMPVEVCYVSWAEA